MNFETLGVFLINPVLAELYIYNQNPSLGFCVPAVSPPYFRYRNDLSLTWTSIFVQSLHFSFDASSAVS